MWDHIINIYLSELLHIKKKAKEFRINKHKKRDNLYFLPNNNILTKLFKELKNIYKNDYQ